MSRYLPALLIVLFMLTGCSSKRLQPHTEPMAQAYPQEYDDLLHALYYKDRGKYLNAYHLFERLYEKTSQLNYKIEAIQLLIALKSYDRAETELKELIQTYPNDAQLYRLLAVVALKKQQFDHALEYAQKALTLEPDYQQNSNLVATIYLIRGNLQKAYETYHNYYMRHHDKESLMKMASILFHRMKRYQETIELLETHSKMVGCSEDICLLLADIYRRKNDLDHLASIYIHLYESTGSIEYAQKAAEIYAYQKQFDRAIELLEKSGADDQLLLAIYKQTQKFKKAATLAKRLYDETHDPVWLAEYGVLRYEAAPQKDNPKLLSSIIKDLSTALQQGVKDHLYYNYLGYLLIDHNIDVEWGMELVKEALKAEPDSAFYIDSLAWGYYKLHNCQKAYDAMKRVVDMLGLKDPEVQKHWKKIQHCRSR